MKNKLYIIFLAFLFLSVLSCTSKQEGINSVQTILIDPDKVEDKIDISFLVEDDFEIVKLETTSENLISRVKKLIHKYDCYFVVDEVSENLYMFNQTGKYMGRIGERGGGPGEYSRLEDVYVENGEIYLLDELGYILVYNLEGCFNRRISFPVEFYSNEFLIKKNGLFFVCNYRRSYAGNYRFYYFNLESNTLSKQLSFESKMINRKWGLNKYMDEYKDEILIMYGADDKVYQLTDTTLTPRYQIKFSSREVPQALKKQDNLTFLMECKKNRYLFGIDNLTNLGKYLVAEYSDGEEGRVILFNKELASVSVCNWLIVSDLGELYCTNIFHNDSMLFIVQDAYMFKDAWESIYSKNSFKNENDKQRLNDLALKLTGDENPIIFNFKLKH